MHSLCPTNKANTSNSCECSECHGLLVCVRPTSKRPWSMIHSMPCRNLCRLYIHFAFTYSVGPSSIVWSSELDRLHLFPPMRVLEVKWYGLSVSFVKWPLFQAVFLATKNNSERNVGWSEDIVIFWTKITVTLKLVRWQFWSSNCMDVRTAEIPSTIFSVCFIQIGVENRILE